MRDSFIILMIAMSLCAGMIIGFTISASNYETKEVQVQALERIVQDARANAESWRWLYENNCGQVR